jgi:hypothetical protein
MRGQHHDDVEKAVGAPRIICRLTGATGPDSISGLAGRDVLIGGDNNDVLAGGADRDTRVAASDSTGPEARARCVRLDAARALELIESRARNGI